MKKMILGKSLRKMIFAWVLFIGLMFAPLYAIAGDATLTWNAPTTNTDASCVTDHAGFNVYFGTSSGSYNTELTNVPATCNDTGVDAGTGCGNIISCNYIATDIPDGMRYFVVTAFDLAGNNSEPSNEQSKLIDGTSPSSPANLTVDINVNVTVTVN
ncbi:hypothetical protein MNBD_GAMMA01-1342 [hydrothermal vent metagenome]|uniref:Uncharacterized protein n=1 Tax=hydrothermal vent metagenome TaxID=652676 RepID=A0A3B0VE95_9ZZZZ